MGDILSSYIITVFVLVDFEAFKLPRSNRGKERKVVNISIEEVSLICMGGDKKELG